MKLLSGFCWWRDYKFWDWMISIVALMPQILQLLLIIETVKNEPEMYDEAIK